MPYKPNQGPLQMPRYQAPMAQLAPQQPGMGQQLAQSAAKKLAAEQIGKMGLQAAGTAAAGPLGGAVAGAAGDLAGPLASQLVGSLFNKGGPVYLQGGGFWDNYNRIYEPASADMKKQWGPLTQSIMNKNPGTSFANAGQQAWEQLGTKLNPTINPSDYSHWGSDLKAQLGPKAQEYMNKYPGMTYNQATALATKDLQIPVPEKVEAPKKGEAPKVEAPVEEVPVDAFEEAPAPAPVDRAVGGKSGGSGTWNIPLGQIGDWSIGTQGSWQGGTKMNDGSRQKGGWDAGITATAPSSFLNNLFGGDPNAVAKSADIYDKSVAKDIAEKNKGSSAYWKSLGYSDDEAMDKVLESIGMNQGGPVKQKKSIWGKIKDKVTGDFKKRSALMGGNKKPQYKQMGGMTPGPLGMSDLQVLGKPEDVSKVVMKKKGGDVEDTVELNYHAPLKYQKPTSTGE